MSDPSTIDELDRARRVIWTHEETLATLRVALQEAKQHMIDGDDHGAFLIINAALSWKGES